MASAFIGPLGMVAFLGIKTLNLAAFQPQSKETRVTRSDRRTLDYLTRAHYDPQAWINVIERLMQYSSVNQGFYIVDYFESHPIDEERVALLSERFNALPLEAGEDKTHPLIYNAAVKGVREMYRAA